MQKIVDHNSLFKEKKHRRKFLLILKQEFNTTDLTAYEHSQFSVNSLRLQRTLLPHATTGVFLRLCVVELSILTLFNSYLLKINRSNSAKLCFELIEIYSQ